MGSIIVVMPKTEDAKKIAGALRSRGLNVDMATSLGAEALQCMNSRDYGVVVSGYRMQDMSYLELNDSRPKYFEMILLVSESKLYACDESAVNIVTMPLQVPRLVDAVNVSMSRMDRQVSHDKKGPGSRSEEERRIIEEAQVIVMNMRGYGRIESYRFIQKKSMDNSISMVDMARHIIANGCL